MEGRVISCHIQHLLFYSMVFSTPEVERDILYLLPSVYSGEQQTAPTKKKHLTLRLLAENWIHVPCSLPNKYFQFHSYQRLLRAPDPATQALNTSRDSWLCEAKIENNPLCGSFLPRFAGLAESWITGNHFQNWIRTKNSSTAPWTIFRRMRKSLSRVCTSQL